MPRAVFMTVLVGCLATACGSRGALPDTPGAPNSLFIGEVEGTDAKIALVRDDSRFTAYVCGGPASLSSLTTWFEGDLAASGLDDVTARSKDRTLEAAFTGDSAAGALTVGGGIVFHFEAQRVDSSLAGLFHVVVAGCRTGLIIPPMGEGEPQGVYCAPAATRQDESSGLVFEQVTPLARLRAGDLGVRARVVGESTDLYLRRVTLLPDGS